MAAVFKVCAKGCAGLAKGCGACGKVACKGCAKCCRYTFKQCRKCCKSATKKAEKKSNLESFFDDSDISDEDIGEGANQGELPPLLIVMDRSGAARNPNLCVTCGTRVESAPS
jgi:hypothetical protein